MRRLATAPGSAAFIAAALTLAAAPGAPLRAQDLNVMLPVSLIEQRLKYEPMDIIEFRGARVPTDRTQRASLVYPDSSLMAIQFAKAPRGGAEFNNEPRYEMAAYVLQKLFLDERDYVVPPTAIRAVPLDWLRGFDPSARATFSRANSVVIVIQYWLYQVSQDNFYDPARFAADTVYARHFADFNLFTHLVNHSDANIGNYLISTSTVNPRVFAVDNGVAFRSEPSDRGFEWRDLRVDRLPRATVERLRALTEADLQAALGVLVQFEVQEGELVMVEPGAPLSTSRGVRESGGVVQFGLTNPEIRDVWNRMRNVLNRVDSGRITVF